MINKRHNTNDMISYEDDPDVHTRNQESTQTSQPQGKEIAGENCARK